MATTRRGRRMAIKNQIEGIKTRHQEIRTFLENVPYKKVDNYIDKNITDLKTAKVFLKKLTKIVLYILKEA